MSFHVEGIEDALLEFDRMDTVLHSKEIAQAFQVAGDYVAARAKELVPVYAGPAREDVTPGELRDAIFAHSYVKDGAPAVVIGVRQDEAPYGPFIEFGTEHNAAQPFLRPAIDGTADTTEQLVAAAIAKLLEH